MVIFNNDIKDLAKVLGKSLFGCRATKCAMHYCHSYFMPTIPRLILNGVILCILGPFFRSRSYVPYVDFPITTRCTLHCKECLHLTPVYKEKALDSDFSLDVLLDNIRLFNALIDKCCDVNVLGGEPFLHKHLHEVVKELISLKKTKRIIIVTNGTIVPHGKNLEVLKNKKVIVYISDYGKLSSKSDELLKLFRKNGVRVYLNDKQTLWSERGNIEYRNYSDTKVKRLFGSCSFSVCKQLYDGKLWLCPIASHSAKLGFVPENPREYIDLRTTSKEEFLSKLNMMYESFNDYTSCRYCAVPDSKKVPKAEQA